MPRISIIVPIFKVEQYIRRCIDSILNQTYADFELILVDDGSPDGCPAICDEYAKNDNRIIVVHKQNGGLSDARNAGLDIAKGEYIYFCDSDDYIHPDLLSTVVSYMDDGYDMTVFQLYTIDENGNIIHISQMDTCDFSLETDSRKKFILDYFLPIKLTWTAWNRMYRRSVIEEHTLRFEDNKRIFAEDLYFCLCYCAYCDKICLIDKPLYYYCLRKDSIMRKDESIGNVDRFSLLAQAVFNTWKKDGSVEELLSIFPIIYYLILYHELGTLKKNRVFTDRQVRAYLYSHLPNMDFFLANLSKMGEQMPLLDHGKYDKEYHRKVYELKYWQDNCYICYKTKCDCYNMLCDLHSFFCRISAFVRYRTKKLFNNA